MAQKPAYFSAGLSKNIWLCKSYSLAGDSGMWSSWGKPLVIAAIAVAAMGQAKQGAKAPDALVRARQAYNAGQIDTAISAAKEALTVPALANGAALVLGRAHLDRYRQTNTADDLEQGRKALQLVVPDQLSPKDRVEFLVGLGVSLYLDGCDDGCWLASAELFAVALARADDPTDRERIFEWWAGALDHQAQFSPEADRVAIFRRILDGASAELARHDRAASASYWVAVAARGTGDLERAWGAAIAAWVRARGLGVRGEALRADLDRFVTQVLLPERARQASPEADPRPQFSLLLQQWEEIKKRYS